MNREEEDDVKGGDTATSARRSSTLTGTAALQAATTRKMTASNKKRCSKEKVYFGRGKQRPGEENLLGSEEEGWRFCIMSQFMHENGMIFRKITIKSFKLSSLQINVVIKINVVIISQLNLRHILLFLHQNF